MIASVVMKEVRFRISAPLRSVVEAQEGLHVEGLFDGGAVVRRRRSPAGNGRSDAERDPGKQVDVVRQAAVPEELVAALAIHRGGEEVARARSESAVASEIEPRVLFERAAHHEFVAPSRLGEGTVARAEIRPIEIHSDAQRAVLREAPLDVIGRTDAQACKANVARAVEVEALDDTEDVVVAMSLGAARK